MSAQTNAAIARMFAEQREIKRQLSEVTAEYRAFRKACEDMPKSITAELDSIDGRRIFYMLNGTQSFTVSDDGNRGQPINFLVSQDGPFVMTHFPMVTWKPNAPSNATNFGRWRPVSSWPLPDQALNADTIDISYEMVDGGSQRNFQNLPSGAGPFSRPDNFVPVPVPTLFAPNTTIQFFPTYEDISFDAAGTPTTGGLLSVVLPGYRIVNM